MKTNNRLTIGIAGHVDAGKTTLTEALLFRTGAIRKLGRVDHRDSFLDTDGMERSRGITIFSKQAILEMGDWNVTLLDTPGHADFSAEMERTLRVLDYAILIINGKSGVQQHTETLWKLLEDYSVPTIIFCNKMDIVGTDKAVAADNIAEKLTDSIVDMSLKSNDEAAWFEACALCDESLLDELLERGSINIENVARSISERHIFPCFYGSALKLQGVDEMIEGFAGIARAKTYADETASIVYKITHDDRCGRLTHMKVTGGRFPVKSMICTGEKEEKINRIRLYNGDKYEVLEEAEPGMVVALEGLENTYAGQSLGAEKPTRISSLEMGDIRKVKYPEGTNTFRFIQNLSLLEEELPEIQLYVTEEKDILIRTMGAVQIEVIEGLILDRFNIKAELVEYVPPVYEEEEEPEEEEIDDRPDLNARWLTPPGGRQAAGDDELQRIFEMTYGKKEDKVIRPAKIIAPERPVQAKYEGVQEYLLVDGYNIIHAWPELSELCRISLGAARDALVDMMCQYRSWVDSEVIVVFDAYKVGGGVRRTEKHGNIFVVYTEEAESADKLIERVSYLMKKKYRVKVATSDYTERIVVLGNNATPIWANQFKEEVDRVNDQIRKWLEDYKVQNSLANLNRIKIPDPDNKI